MSPQHDKHAEMQAKLSEGLNILASASQEDLRSLNDALLKIHAALEDFVRLELAAKQPHLREEVENKRTTWKTLISYAKEHLGFSENDVQMITEANHQRQSVAHGGNYSGSLSELVTYSGFVQKWVNRDRTAAVELRPMPVAAPSPPPSDLADYNERPWYRSTPFLLLCFFLLPPLWAWLILTDRNQAGVAKLVAGGILAFACFVVLGVLYVWNVFPGTPTPDNPALQSDVSPPSMAAPVRVTDEAAVAPRSTSATGGDCSITWVEHPSDLGAKTRAMVWQEIVEQQVRGSGMTHREFYDLVVEHNPHLAADGYEFRRGKTYLLPRCG